MRKRGGFTICKVVLYKVAAVIILLNCRNIFITRSGLTVVNVKVGQVYFVVELTRTHLLVD